MAEKDKSKKEWESLISVIQREVNRLKGWLTKDANPKVTNLQKLITGDLKDVDKRWECETSLRIISTLLKLDQAKLPS